MTVVGVGSVVSADVDVLDHYSALGGILAGDRDIDAAVLREALGAVRRATTDVPFTVEPVEDRLAAVARQWAEVDDDVGRVSRELRRADGGGPIEAVVLSVVLATVEAERRHGDRPWEVDRALVDARVGALRRLLGWSGEDDGVCPAGAAVPLDRVTALLDDLHGPELDAVLAALSDDELRALYRDRSAEEVRNFEVLVGETVSIHSWRRLARFSPAIDPDPADAGADRASGAGRDEDYYRSLRYAPVPGDLVRPHEGESPFGFGDSAQGRLGDCYLLAAMQALARQDPDALARLFQVNGNGTVTVTFADGSKTVVSKDMPHEDDGDLAFAQHREGAGADLWPLVLEKAYAQRYGGWDAIGNGGHPSEALERLTGRPAEFVDEHRLSIDDLADRLDRDEIVIMSTIPVPAGTTRDQWLDAGAPEPFRRSPPGNLVPQHAFAITSVDREAGTVTAANPWDPTVRSVTLDEQEVRQCLQGVYVQPPA